MVLMKKIGARVLRVVTSVRFIIGVGIAMLLTACGLWQYNNATNPDRVFWGAVETNLSTQSFTRHTSQKNAGATIDQITQVNTSPEKLANSNTQFEQTGVDSASAETEHIGTAYKDYVRYTKIVTSQRNAQGEPLDYSSVVGAWGVNPVVSEDETGGQLYGQSVLNVIPVGRLSLDDRKALMEHMRSNETYEYTLVGTERAFLTMRPTYEYRILVKPAAYLKMLKEFAGYQGLNNLDSVDPSEYEASPLMSFSVKIDGWTRQIVEISQSTGGGVETISGRNLKKVLAPVPSDAVLSTELQSRLQSIQ